MKKLLAVLLALALCLGISVPALADDGEDAVLELPSLEGYLSLYEWLADAAASVKREDASAFGNTSGRQVTVSFENLLLPDAALSVALGYIAELNKTPELACIGEEDQQSGFAHDHQILYYQYTGGGTVGGVICASGMMCNVGVHIWWTGERAFELVIVMGDGIRMGDALPQDVDGLPSPDAWFGYQKQAIHGPNGMYLMNLYDISGEGAAAFEGYLALLQNGPFTLLEQAEETGDYATVKYDFAYTGRPLIGDLIEKDGQTLAVSVTMYYGRGEDGVSRPESMDVTYCRQLALVDHGDRFAGAASTPEPTAVPVTPTLAPTPAPTQKPAPTPNPTPSSARSAKEALEKLAGLGAGQ